MTTKAAQTVIIVVSLAIVAFTLGWAFGVVPTAVAVAFSVGVVLGVSFVVWRLQVRRSAARRQEKEHLRRSWQLLMLQYGNRPANTREKQRH